MSRLVQTLRKVREADWSATLQLALRCGRPGAIMCRGNVELQLAADARVRALGRRSVIGARIAGATPSMASTVLDVRPAGELTLDDVVIGRGSRLYVGPGARLRLGVGTYANEAKLFASLDISIGVMCAISWGVTIIDDDGHGFGPPPYSKAIVIEDRVWIGCGATVLKGVTVGEGSVVAAGAVVTRSCPPRSLLAGVPARVVRSGVEWTDEQRDHLRRRDESSS